MSGFDILLDEFVVMFVVYVGVMYFKVVIVVKMFYIVGIDVENDWEYVVRVNFCSCGVYG